MNRAIVVAGLLIPGAASAHIALTSPLPRTSQLKKGPCGDGPASVRGTPDDPIAPGSTITVTWYETVEHPSHYRISFDPDGQHFSVPPDTTSDTSKTDPLVLMDLIHDVQGNFPDGGRRYDQVITLPNVECDGCTLQVIQLMTDKPPYTTDSSSNDIYYQCADLTLKAGAPAPDAGTGGGSDGVDAGMGGGGSGGGAANGGGGGCSAGGSAGWPIGGVLAMLIARRRRARG